MKDMFLKELNNFINSLWEKNNHWIVFFSIDIISLREKIFFYCHYFPTGKKFFYYHYFLTALNFLTAK